MKTSEKNRQQIGTKISKKIGKNGKKHKNPMKKLNRKFQKQNNVTNFFFSIEEKMRENSKKNMLGNSKYIAGKFHTKLALKF